MNAKKRTQKGIKSILDATELTQRDFAAMIGASLDTVKSWSSGRAVISPEFRTRIILATGAEINDMGYVTVHWRVGSQCEFLGKPYCKEAFDFWREKVARTDEGLAELEALRHGTAIALLYRAAAQKIRGRNYKLPAITRAFEEWLVEMTENFTLEPIIERLPKRKMETRTMPAEDFFWYKWRKARR